MANSPATAAFSWKEPQNQAEQCPNLHRIPSKQNHELPLAWESQGVLLHNPLTSRERRGDLVKELQQLYPLLSHARQHFHE